MNSTVHNENIAGLPVDLAQALSTEAGALNLSAKLIGATDDIYCQNRVEKRRLSKVAAAQGYHLKLQRKLRECPQVLAKSKTVARQHLKSCEAVLSQKELEYQNLHSQRTSMATKVAGLQEMLSQDLREHDTKLSTLQAAFEAAMSSGNDETQHEAASLLHLAKKEKEQLLDRHSVERLRIDHLLRSLDAFDGDLHQLHQAVSAAQDAVRAARVALQRVEMDDRTYTALVSHLQCAVEQAAEGVDVNALPDVKFVFNNPDHVLSLESDVIKARKLTQNIGRSEIEEMVAAMMPPDLSVFAQADLSA